MANARTTSRRPPAPARGEEWLALDGRHAALRYTSADDAILRKARLGIEAHRKVDARLVLTDRQGRPLADTPAFRAGGMAPLRQPRHTAGALFRRPV